MTHRKLDIEREACYSDWDRWAIAAMAARFARRVHPLFEAGWPGAPREHMEALERALLLTETFAATPPTDTQSAFQATMALTATARTIAAHAGQMHPGAAEAARAVASAAATAASAACEANAAIRAANTATHALAAAAHIAPAAQHPAHLAATADAERLHCAIANGTAGSTTAISPDWFGPMWPDGLPEGWPEVDTATGNKVDPDT